MLQTTIAQGTIDATCGQVQLGQTFGPFTLVAYTDVDGNVCNGGPVAPPCDGTVLQAEATTTSNAVCGTDCTVLCFESTEGDAAAAAQVSLDVNEGANTITVRKTYAKTFCDNTYGSNVVDWPGNNHTFTHLKGSDRVELALYNGDGGLALQFELD